MEDVGGDGGRSGYSVLIMLESHGVKLPLPVVWSPPGPFCVEIDEFGQGWDALRRVDTLVEASRLASRTLRRDWRVARNWRRIRIEGPRGVE